VIPYTMRRAFTLLEMMVVVAIVGIVSALGVVSITELVKVTTQRSAVDSVTDQMRELRDRAERSGQAVILVSDSGVGGKTVGVALRAEPCDQIATCPAPNTFMDVPSSHTPLSLKTSGARLATACINPDGRMFVEGPTCEFVNANFELTMRNSGLPLGCTECVIARGIGTIDPVVTGARNKCSADGQCGRASCDIPSGRCIPPGGLERVGDAGRLFGEPR
jgi:prepilin-type N-terminal cleavage/methylation domain-containing protein